MIVAQVENLKALFYIERPFDPLDDIIDICEIAAHLPLVENPDRRSFNDRLGKTVIGHVGSSPGTVDGKETQAPHWYSKEMMIGKSQRFARFFGSAVKAGGMICRIVFRKGHFLIESVNRRRGGEDKLHVWSAAAHFQHFEESVDIAVDIAFRM